MTNLPSELDSLRQVSPQATQHTDGNVVAVLMPDTRLITPAGPLAMNVVLCPNGLGGYATRLLLERRIPEKPALNWQEVALLGRSWQTWSWNEISPSQPWIQIFAEHARVLR